MVFIREDHFLAFTTAKVLNEYLNEYERAGFLSMGTLNHNLGKKIGFIKFSPEYIELHWIENQEEFDSKANDFWVQASKSNDIFSVAFAVDNINQLNNYWESLNIDVMEPGYIKVPGSKAEYNFAIVNTPEGLMNGIHTFFVQYLSKEYALAYPENEPKKIEISPNGIYAIKGLTMLISDSSIDLERWAQALHIDKKSISKKRMFVGPHEITIKTYDEFNNLFQDKASILTESSSTTCLIHLLTVELRRTQEYLSKVNWKCMYLKSSKEREIYLNPPRDGFKFIISQMDINDYMKLRKERSGELLIKEEEGNIFTN